MTATKQFIGNIANHVNNSSTFEVWKDLTNDMATLIGTNSVVLETNQFATTPSVGMANTGKMFLDGNIQLAPGRMLISDTIISTGGSDKVIVDDDALIKGVLHLNRQQGNTSNPVEIQIQNGVDVNTWHIKTDSSHDQLRIGTPTRDIYFNADGSVTTSSDLALKFTFDNELLGPTIDGIAIGGTTPASGDFTTITSTLGITGNIRGDVKSAQSQVVLSNGSDGTNAWFKGVIKATDGTTVLNNGQASGQATFVGDVTGNVLSESSGNIILNTSDNTAIFTGNLSGNSTTSSSCTGNSATATKFRSTVLIGGEDFDGSSEITLAGVNKKGNQDTSGLAAKATQVAVTNTEKADLGTLGVVFAVSHNDTPEGTSYQRTLYNDAGLAFDPSSNSLTVANGGVTTVDSLIAKGAFTAKGNITLDAGKKLRGDVANANGDTIVDVSAGEFYGNATTATTAANTTGNAGTATKLLNKFTIGGVSFDGSEDVNLPGVNRAGNQDVNARVLSSDGSVCLDNSISPENSTFAGVSHRSSFVKIDSQKDGLNSSQTEEHYITFVDGIGPPGETAGSTNRQANTSSYQNLEDHNLLRYTPKKGLLKTQKIMADIVRPNESVLLDISGSHFDGTANHASTANRAYALYGKVYSENNGLTLDNGSEPSEATFTGTSYRAQITQIYSQPDGAVDEAQNNDHFIVFTDGNDDVTGTTTRVPNTTTYQNLEDHNLLRYNPRTGLLKSSHFLGNIIKPDGHALVDHVNSRFYGKATSAGSADKATSADIASACRGNAASASQVKVSQLSTSSSSGYSFAMVDHTVNTNKNRSVLATTAIQYQPNESGGITTFSGPIRVPQGMTGTASSAFRFSHWRTVKFTGNHVSGEFKIGAEGSSSARTRQVTLSIKDNAGFKVHADDITGLNNYIDKNYIPLDRIYPVGSIYITTEPGNPSTKFGGEWSKFSQGRFLIGDGNSGQYLAPTFNADPDPQNHPGHPGSGQPTLAKQAAQGYGGYYEHKLSINEMPSHRHSIDTGWQFQVQLYKSAVTNIREFRDGTASRHTTDYTNYTGGSQPHNNMPPFTVVYMWRRDQ